MYNLFQSLINYCHALLGIVVIIIIAEILFGTGAISDTCIMTALVGVMFWWFHKVFIIFDMIVGQNPASLFELFMFGIITLATLMILHSLSLGHDMLNGYGGRMMIVGVFLYPMADVFVGHIDRQLESIDFK